MINYPNLLMFLGWVIVIALNYPLIYSFSHWIVFTLQEVFL